MLRRLVVARIVKDMRTARGQKEANTVLTKNTGLEGKGQANPKPRAQRWHGQRSATRIERDYLWSRPSCAAMSLGLGISFAVGTGPVPV